MVVVNYLFIVLFIIAAALQYNDPDPYIWMPLYLYGAWLCWLAIKKNYKPLLYILGIVIYASYGLYLFFDRNGVVGWMNEHHSESIVQTMKATKPWIEETREFFGLVILIFALLMNMIWLASEKRKSKLTIDHLKSKQRSNTTL